MTRDNNLLGKFELNNIAPAPRGVPQIEVTFEIDANGIMKVSAADKGTGRSESITITNDKGRLSKEEIDRMVQEAEEFAEQDEAVRKRVEALNALQNFVSMIRTQVTDKNGLGGKLDDADKETVMQHLKEADAWLEENGENADAQDIEEQLTELQAAISPITAKVYQGGAGAGQDEPLDYHDEL